MSKCNTVFLVLDIETSSKSYTRNDKGGTKILPLATWLSYGWCKLYSTGGDTIKKCYFEEWEELAIFLGNISIQYHGKEIRCYVHNLAYEFDYMIKNLSPCMKLLSNSSHSPIQAILKDFPQIEFCCSYQLTGMSLRKLGDIVGLPKLDSEYRTIYPHDFITQEEIDYCERDCDIVALYISKVLLKEYGQLYKCPFTKTGRVRKTLHKFYQLYNNGDEWDLMPDEDCYQALLDSFNGGIVISNPYFTNIEVKNVSSYDITSSYPFAIITETYPYSIHRIASTTLPSSKHWLCRIRFHDIKSKYPWGWLSASKMHILGGDKAQYFNGKLIYSPMVERTITNVDFELINKTYDYSHCEIIEAYECPKWGDIPKCYIETIKLYSQRKFELKAELKKIEKIQHVRALTAIEKKELGELELEYMMAKADFNSIYGMCVQKICQQEFEIDEEFNWNLKDQRYRKIPNKHLKRNFLFGIFITAYARKNLLTAILTNCPYSFVYSDTDSIKYFATREFIDTNPILTDEYRKIPSLAKLGRFDAEGTYDRFITLGAKKYAFYKDGELGITVAGLPKTEVKKLNSLSDFKCGAVFNDCKLAKRYITTSFSYELDDEGNVINKEQFEATNFITEHEIESHGGVALYPTSYVLDMTEQDKFYTFELQANGLKYYIKTHNLESFIEKTPY